MRTVNIIAFDVRFVARQSNVALAALGGGFNWSMQHTRRHCGGRSVADEAKTAHLLLGQPTGTHVGALAEG
jgi:hypothetical protein